MLRIGIIGARQNRQGIGHHIARHLTDLGAQVTAIVGTTPQTLDEAILALKQQSNIDARGYLSLEEMLKCETLDAVAICSPAETHLRYLQSCLRAGVAVLCEKPLVFSREGDWLADAAAVIDGFASAGKLLMVNEQWPYTLPTFAALYPTAIQHDRPPTQLDVLLSPAERGLAMIPSALPHVLSLLLALAPAQGEVRNIRVQARHGDGQGAEEVSVDFQYVHTRGTTAVRACFRHATSQPRTAACAINGCAVQRVIEMPPYAMFFERARSVFETKEEAPPDYSGGNRIPLPDPLKLLLADFVERMHNPARPCPRTGADHAAILQSLRMLHAVYRAAES